MTRSIRVLPGHSFPENPKGVHQWAFAGVGTFSEWLTPKVAPASKGQSLCRSEWV